MTENKAKYIHFEGMDLAGKSLAAKNLMERSGENWQLRRNSINLNNPSFELADSVNKSKDIKYSSETLGNLYIAALMADIESFSRPDCNTIQDSTIILRSLAYHTVNGTPRITDIMTDLLPKHPKFDFSFVEFDYSETFYNWIEYKKDRKQSYRTQKSLEACYQNLKLLSDFNPVTAKQIVLNSISNNWSGLFKIKTDKQTKQDETRNYIASRIAQVTGGN